MQVCNQAKVTHKSTWGKSPFQDPPTPKKKCLSCFTHVKRYLGVMLDCKVICRSKGTQLLKYWFWKGWELFNTPILPSLAEIQPCYPITNLNYKITQMKNAVLDIHLPRNDYHFFLNANAFSYFSVCSLK